MSDLHNLPLCFLSVFAGMLLLTGCGEDPVNGGDVPVSGITLDPVSLQLAKGDEAAIMATVSPDNATDKTVLWESSDTEVAEVTQEGVVSAISEGAATITATAGDKTAFCTVTVSEIGVESVTVEPSAAEIIKGETVSLSAAVLPENAEITTVQWSSSNEDIATVDSKGTVTGVGTGAVTILAEAGGKWGSCDVTVLPVSVESVTVSPESLEMRIGEVSMLSASVLPEDAEDRSVVWSSSDELVATVSETGEVTAVGAGNAKITAASGEISGECSVTVIGDPQIGDFYYSDGTYSPELDTDKTPIGVIFWVGDPGVSDPTLRADHPECINGLAVSLDGEFPTAWQSGNASYGKEVNDWVEDNTDFQEIIAGKTSGNSSDDLLNSIVGYNNTKAIEAFNAAPENAAWPVEAVSELAAYREKVPVPESCSGWYLPSTKELSLLCAGEIDGNIWGVGDFGGSGRYSERAALVNEKLAQIDGAMLLMKDFTDPAVTYWASQEITSEYALNLFFRFGQMGHQLKDWQYGTNGRVRFILAF